MKEERTKKENPFKENESEGTYLAEGLSIGMCLGLAIGMSIKKGNKKEE